MNEKILLELLISFIINWILIYVNLPFFRKFFPDKPNKRSSHIQIKPSGLGTVFVVTSSVFFFIHGNFLFLANSLLGFVGLIDDRLNLSASIRFFAQFLFVNFLIQQSDQFNTIFENNLLIINFIIWLISNLILIGIINFINFMDGIDGLVAGSMIFVVLTTSVILNLNFYSLISALLAFLFWNWSPSRVFMGDVGSTFLGGFIVSAITNASSIEFSLLIFISCIPLLLDALVCLLRRFIDNQKIFKPHKLHLYQRLVQTGWSHSLVSSIYIGSSAIISITCISQNIFAITLAIILLIIFGYSLDKNYAKPFISS